MDDGNASLDLPETIELAIGMNVNVMPGVTSNIIFATDLQLDITNRYGARGMTVDVMLMLFSTPKTPELPR